MTISTLSRLTWLSVWILHLCKPPDNLFVFGHFRSVMAHYDHSCSLHRLGDALNVSISAQDRFTNQLELILERTPGDIQQSQSSPVINAGLRPAREAREIFSPRPKQSSRTPLALPALEASSAHTSSLRTASPVTYTNPNASTKKLRRLV